MIFFYVFYIVDGIVVFVFYFINDVVYRCMLKKKKYISLLFLIILFINIKWDFVIVILSIWSVYIVMRV